MKELAHIKKIIAFMALALIGLVVLQCYWIKRDFDLANQQLEQQVALAINQAAERYLASQIKERPHRKIVSHWNEVIESPNNYFFYMDSTTDKGRNVEVTVNMPKIVRKRGVKPATGIEKKTENEELRVYIETKGADSMVVIERFEGSEDYDSSAFHTSEVYVEATSSGTATTSVNSWTSTSGEVSKIVTEAKEVYQDTLTRERVVASMSNIPQVSKKLITTLDSLLQQSFSEQNLTLPYANALNDDMRETWLFATPNFNKEDKENGWAVPVITRELPAGKYSLHVQLPDKNNYLLQETLAVIISSILLIAVIAVCFWITVRIVLKQKKVAAIKSDFINNMTHEFKTPISNVSLAMEALLNFGMLEKPEMARKYLEIAQKENVRLGKQVEKVLQMALLEKEDFQLKYKSINLHELIEETANSFRTTIANRSGSLALSLDATNAVVAGDELHLTNVLANLLDNANKYSPDSPQITMSTETSPEGVWVKVSDKGMGIREEEQSKIFEKFYRFPTGNVHDVKGFGLGLSYVGQIVQKHGGKITVVSKEGAGSTFSVLLPYKMTE